MPHKGLIEQFWWDSHTMGNQEFCMKYLNIKDSLEKMQMKPATNGKKKREET